MKRTVCAIDEGNIAQEPDAKRCKTEEDEQENVLQVDMQEFECVICADLMVDPVVGRCGHDFCKECLDDWVHRNRHSPNCPVCRKSLGSSQEEHGVCLRLKELIQKLFPRRSKDRRKEVEQEAAERKRRREQEAEQRRREQQQRQAAYAAAMAGGRAYGFHRMRQHPALAAAMSGQPLGDLHLREPQLRAINESLGRMRAQLDSMNAFIDEQHGQDLARYDSQGIAAAIARNNEAAAALRGSIRTRSAARRAEAAAAGAGSGQGAVRSDAAAAAAAGRGVERTPSPPPPLPAPNAPQLSSVAISRQTLNSRRLLAAYGEQRQRNIMADGENTAAGVGILGETTLEQQEARPGAPVSRIGDWFRRGGSRIERRQPLPPQQQQEHGEHPVEAARWFRSRDLHRTDGMNLYDNREINQVCDDAAAATRAAARRVAAAAAAQRAMADRGGAGGLTGTAEAAATATGGSRQRREPGAAAWPASARESQDDWLAGIDFDNPVGRLITMGPLMPDAEPADGLQLPLPPDAMEEQWPAPPVPAAPAAAVGVGDDEDEPAYVRRMRDLSHAVFRSLHMEGLRSTHESPAPPAAAVATRDGRSTPGAARASMIPVIPVDDSADRGRAVDDVRVRAVAAAAAQAAARARNDRRLAERRRAAELAAADAPAADHGREDGNAGVDRTDPAAAVAVSRRHAADDDRVNIPSVLLRGQPDDPSSHSLQRRHLLWGEGLPGNAGHGAGTHAEISGSPGEAAEQQRAGGVEEAVVAAAAAAARIAADPPAAAAAGEGAVARSGRILRIKREAQAPAVDSDESSGPSAAAAVAVVASRQGQQQQAADRVADSSRRGAFLDMMAAADRHGSLLRAPAVATRAAAYSGAAQRFRHAVAGSVGADAHNEDLPRLWEPSAAISPDESAGTEPGDDAPPAQPSTTIRPGREPMRMRIRFRAPHRAVAARAEGAAESQPHAARAPAAAALAPAPSAELAEEVARATARHVRREVEGLLSGGMRRRQMAAAAPVVVDGGYISSGSDDE